MRVEPLPGPSWPARQRAQVWRGGRAVVWHAVRVSGDSHSGVPFVHPPSCDSCRIGLPLAEVDSVCAGPADHGDREVGVLAAAGMLTGLFLWLLT